MLHAGGSRQIHTVDGRSELYEENNDSEDRVPISVVHRHLLPVSQHVNHADHEEEHCERRDMHKQLASFRNSLIESLVGSACGGGHRSPFEL